MLGRNFRSFLTLLVLSVAVAAIYDWILRYRFLEGIDSFLAKVAVGWLGGWLGSPVLGHWLWKIQNIYLVPAVPVRSPLFTSASGEPTAHDGVYKVDGHRRPEPHAGEKNFRFLSQATGPESPLPPDFFSSWAGLEGFLVLRQDFLAMAKIRWKVWAEEIILLKC